MIIVHEVPPASSFLLCVVRAVGLWGWGCLEPILGPKMTLSPLLTRSASFSSADCLPAGQCHYLGGSVLHSDLLRALCEALGAQPECHSRIVFPKLCHCCSAGVGPWGAVLEGRAWGELRNCWSFVEMQECVKKASPSL